MKKKASYAERLFAVILAGGSGNRFWPMSRQNRPKHLIPILGERTMLEETFNRMAPLVPPERTYVVTGEDHSQVVRNLLPMVPPENILVEPCQRNTAPCIGLAAMAIRRVDPDATMAILPADHYVGDTAAFRETVMSAHRLAATGRLVTIGVRPIRPETGYGYIKVGAPLGEEQACVVESFVEKPNLIWAVQYLASGRYLWNSGMFFFTPRRVFEEISKHLPLLHSSLEKVEAARGRADQDEVLEEQYCGLDGISMDYGVMEHAKDIAVLSANFSWSDVGHWAALAEVRPLDDNDCVHQGQVLDLHGRGNIIVTDAGIVAAIGLNGMIVVRAGDAVLVCPKDRAQDVRQVVEQLKRRQLKEFL